MRERPPGQPPPHALAIIGPATRPAITGGAMSDPTTAPLGSAQDSSGASTDPRLGGGAVDEAALLCELLAALSSEPPRFHGTVELLLRHQSIGYASLEIADVPGMVRLAIERPGMVARSGSRAAPPRER